MQKRLWLVYFSNCFVTFHEIRWHTRTQWQIQKNKKRNQKKKKRTTKRRNRLSKYIKTSIRLEIKSGNKKGKPNNSFTIVTSIRVYLKHVYKHINIKLT